jgi:hypothetical protein
MKISHWLAWLAVILAGCVRNSYEVEVAPVGGSLDRKLTVRQQTRGSGPANAFDEEVRKIAAEYRVAPPPPPAAAKKHEFQGRFAGRLPQDVGGYGTFMHWETELGSVSIYVERFRGDDDAEGVLKRRQASADRLVELAVAWLRPELEADPQWPGFRQFLQKDFRRDLHNVTIYAWTMGMARTSDDFTEALVRGLQYVVERGYITPDDVPAISRAISDAQRGEPERLMTLCKRLIAARLGGKIPQIPKGLATPEELVKSLNKFLESTDEYVKIIKEWEKQRATDPHVQRPEGMAVLNRLLGDLFLAGTGVQLGGDQVTVGLNIDRPAIVTNGHWTEESRKINWAARSLSNEGWPALMYAAWDEPDETAQKAHFGKLVLQGEPLLNYCLWYRGLTDAEQQEWDKFIDTLAPGTDHERALNNFRFGHEPADRDRGQRLASDTVAALLKGLKENE